MLRNFFPFLRWFPMRGETLRSDVIAGITVAMILIPQAMAYAALAGLPVVYGLYASFLPVIVASMWGVSRFLHTGPVAMLSLMSAAAIAPLATQGTAEFIKLSVTLALMVGVLRLALGVLRLGVLINFASHPVINGFTNAAALIIGLSLLNTFLNVPMSRSDMFLQDLFNVITQLPEAHLATIAFGVGTLVTLIFLKRIAPKLPGVLIVEAMAQTAASLVVHTLGAESEGKLVYFMSIDNARFRKPVHPGDRLSIDVEKHQSRGNVWKFNGKANVDGQLVAEATFAAMILNE